MTPITTVRMERREHPNGAVVRFDGDVGLAIVRQGQMNDLTAQLLAAIGGLPTVREAYTAPSVIPEKCHLVICWAIEVDPDKMGEAIWAVVQSTIPARLQLVRAYWLN